ncbi:MAG TPA: hypothetical protein VF158_11160 [Longimicrobiales bacterium]
MVETPWSAPFDLIATVGAYLLSLGGLLVIGVGVMYVASLYRADHRRRIMDAGPPRISELRARIGALGELVAGLDSAARTQDREVSALKAQLQRLEAQHNQLVGAVELLSRQLIPAGGVDEDDG